ncbi:hypothetical protein [Streptomyces cylindrosporus]|uniref:Uncharacterized protein n=1 Tax=Streptomyces cylindrosporus TaxID=2927583 RepID=A0ABS9YJN8_9ACTN|nr:hypothetical protein [Streptomyces cylindrosporus]MCI3277461.1 hypothetical protein [Streptomyces cylindrosporus]
MPEPLTDAYLKETQRIIAAVPKGPWKVEPNEHGLPDQVGPIAFLETWVDSDRLPVVEFVAFAREALPRYVGENARQQDENKRLRAEVAAARRFAEEMRNFCSPHGVSVHYANQLVEAMDRAKGGARNGR